MRDGLDAPTFELPEVTVAEIRAFLDGQSRIRLAVWVRHEQQGVDGPMYDHHAVLAVDDADWETGDMRALEDAMWKRLPLRIREPKWIDLCPFSETEALRSFGVVLWEQSAPGGDPLDYRYTSEPFEPDAEAAEEFAAALATLPAVRGVSADVSRLWNGGEEIESTVRLFVDAPIEADALLPVLDAAKASVLAGLPKHSAEFGHPTSNTTLLYEATS